MNSKLLAFVLTVIMVLAIAFPAIACDDEKPPKEGCTPGYWKQPQHMDSWGPTGYDPDDVFDTVFGVDKFGDMTLLEVLKQGGGHDKALGRHAVAALLNASHPDVAGFSVAYVLSLPSKDELEWANELGCPLN